MKPQSEETSFSQTGEYVEVRKNVCSAPPPLLHKLSLQFVHCNIIEVEQIGSQQDYIFLLNSIQFLFPCDLNKLCVSEKVVYVIKHQSDVYEMNQMNCGNEIK